MKKRRETFTVYTFWHANWKMCDDLLFEVADHSLEAARGRLYVDDPVWSKPGVFHFPELNRKERRTTKWGFVAKNINKRMWRKISNNTLTYRNMDLTPCCST